MHFASNTTSSKPVHGTLPGTVCSRDHLVQKCLDLLLRYTGLPVDEDASEIMVGFWYLFQQSLWSVEYEDQAEDQDGTPSLVDVTEKESEPL